mmetsp:Transcript_10383/g.19675  ORF Transcript_10383/g.19675 Transcript_10383/m.19675 type:complete len:243 (-) Transcript_10383:327-1055(-)
MGDRQKMKGGSDASSHTDYGSSDSSDNSWISWFCKLKGNDFFCEADINYLQDSFNLTGLSSLIPYYSWALDMVVDVEPKEELSEGQQELVEGDAETLYGLAHARYIVTNQGLHAMLEKYRQCHFGRCPRYLCRDQPCVPMGLSDHLAKGSVKLYCPRCEEVFESKSPRHRNLDGAFFGTTFPHLFFLTFPELKVAKSEEVYVPRVFGYRVHDSAYRESLEARKKAQAQRKRGVKLLPPPQED